MTEEMTIQGQSVGSVNEYNVGIALSQSRLDYDYQYPIDGGRAVRGGQVIDFLVWIEPRPVALYVQGERWHKGAFDLEATIKRVAAERRGFEVVEIWEHECETPEDALRVVKERIL